MVVYHDLFLSSLSQHELKVNMENVDTVTIVYIGSFSPITIGHRAVIVDTLTLLTLLLPPPTTAAAATVKLLLVPVSDRYPKSSLITGYNSDCNTSHRLKMCQLTADDIKRDHPNFNIEVCSWLIDQQLSTDGGYELMTQYLSCNIRPSSNSQKIGYLCGYDVYQSFDRWPVSSKQLFVGDETAIIDMIVHPRDDDDGISSSRVRDVFARSGTIVDTTAEVAAYIRQHQLLRCNL